MVAWCVLAWYCCGGVGARLPGFAPWPVRGRSLAHTGNGLEFAAIGNNSLLVLNTKDFNRLPPGSPSVKVGGTVYFGSPGV